MINLINGIIKKVKFTFYLLATRIKAESGAKTFVEKGVEVK